MFTQTSLMLSTTRFPLFWASMSSLQSNAPKSYIRIIRISRIFWTLLAFSVYLFTKAHRKVFTFTPMWQKKKLFWEEKSPLSRIVANQTLFQWIGSLSNNCSNSQTLTDTHTVTWVHIYTCNHTCITHICPILLTYTLVCTHIITFTQFYTHSLTCKQTLTHPCMQTHISLHTQHTHTCHPPRPLWRRKEELPLPLFQDLSEVNVLYHMVLPICQIQQLSRPFLCKTWKNCLSLLRPWLSFPFYLHRQMEGAQTPLWVWGHSSLSREFCSVSGP